MGWADWISVTVLAAYVFLEWRDSRKRRQAMRTLAARQAILISHLRTVEARRTARRMRQAMGVGRGA